MKTILNISVKDYFSLSDTSEYDVFIDTLKPKNLFKKVKANINSLTYDEVKMVIRLLSKNITYSELGNIYEIVYKVKDISDGKVIDLFRSKHWIIKEFNNIVQREDKILNIPSDDAAKWEMAGVKRLTPFADLSNKIKIGKMFGVTPMEVGNWKYNDVFTILAYTTISDDVNKQFNSIK